MEEGGGGRGKEREGTDGGWKRSGEQNGTEVGLIVDWEGMDGGKKGGGDMDERKGGGGMNERKKVSARHRLMVGKERRRYR